jgi:prevent-host-death family protein
MATRHVGIRALKNGLSGWVARARDGEEIVVTDRGVAVARLVPASAGPRTLETLIARGLVEPAPEREKRARPQRRVRLRGAGPTLSDYVVEQRR